MATIGTKLNLVDHASRLDPNGKIATIAELLNLQNEVQQDIVYKEGNLETGHRSTIRTGLPSVYFRSINQGVPSSKSTTVQVTDTCALIEAYSKVDVELAALNGNTNEFRASEDMAYLEAMAQKNVETLFYGNTSTDPKAFLGLAPRYASTSEANGDNILKGDGAGSDNTSIWLVGWGERSCHMIYPKKSMAGLQINNIGEEAAYDSDNNEYRVLKTQYTWKSGLVLRDWRYVVRICNIDVSNLTKNAASGSDLINLMVKACELIPNMNGVNPVFYCNRTVRSFLRQQIMNKSNMYLTHETVEGKKVTVFDNVPVRRCDSILNTEATIS